MKKVFALIAVAAMMLSCGGNGQNGTNEKNVNGSGAKISIGDKFAFAGLESDQLVPDFATELSELETDPRSESKPMKDEVFFYTGPDITAIPAAKVQAYLQQVYYAVKKPAVLSTATAMVLYLVEVQPQSSSRAMNRPSAVVLPSWQRFLAMDSRPMVTTSLRPT